MAQRRTACGAAARAAATAVRRVALTQLAARRDVRSQKHMGVNMDPAPLLTDRAAYISYLEARAARACACRGRAWWLPARRASDAPPCALAPPQRQLDAVTAACMQLHSLECRTEQARARAASQRRETRALTPSAALARSSRPRARAKKSALSPWRASSSVSRTWRRRVPRVRALALPAVIR